MRFCNIATVIIARHALLSPLYFSFVFIVFIAFVVTAIIALFDFNKEKERQESESFELSDQPLFAFKPTPSIDLRLSMLLIFCGSHVTTALLGAFVWSAIDYNAI